jgi:hypothetical protein
VFTQTGEKTEQAWMKQRVHGGSVWEKCSEVRAVANRSTGECAQKSHRRSLVLDPGGTPPASPTLSGTGALPLTRYCVGRLPTRPMFNWRFMDRS